LHLPRRTDSFEWTPFVERYWEHFGGVIAAVAPPAVPAPDGVQLRAVRVRPEVVEIITSSDLNIVLERLELAAADRFDLFIVTNVFVYYDVLDQALALTNVAAMLRPGGLLLTNDSVAALPPIPLTLAGYTEVGYTSRPEGDRVFWYERQ
jgi:hypothetical protein